MVRLRVHWAQRKEYIPYIRQDIYLREYAWQKLGISSNAPLH